MRIGGYRIEDRIGLGGAGTVYLALDERLGRNVALKVLPEDLSGDDTWRLRFLREARVAARVDHPNIIPIYEAGESPGGVVYIAMRYVRGGDVRSLLTREGRLSPERAMAIVEPVAAALDAAHAAGLVHRDVKPGNMLLDGRTEGPWHVYLADFGITAPTKADAPDDPTGPVTGTLNYISPEQVEGRSADGRADQFGLACSAFEMLTGAPPFEGSALSIMRAVLFDPAPAISAQRPEIPAAADAVMARALAKSPGDRYPTCGQFAAALGTALGLGLTAGAGRGPGGTVPVAAQARSAPSAAVPLDLPLSRSFRYVHEPSRASDEAFASLGNDKLVSDLEKRIRHSRGGAFLITGFRGVGKSTLVMRALDQLAARSDPAEIIVPVLLSVARSTTTERLLFAIVRRVFETLSDLAVLEKLPPQTRHALLVSYMRTSLAYKETQQRQSQQAAELELGLGAGKLVKAVADIAAPKVTMSASRSHSLATEAAFLAYSETDVEYDLMRIIALVSRTLDGSRGRQSRWPGWLRRYVRRGVMPGRLRLVIVLDEVDKLTVEDKGLAAVEELLSGTKNVLTTSGAHFLVIAGPDLNDRAVVDAARGSGVYESVFGWRMYVPCVWDAPRKLLAGIVSAGRAADPGPLETLEHYLRFKARGVTRRLLQEVNGFVTWDDDSDQPRLCIDAMDIERVTFYARIERIMRGYLEGRRGTRLFPVAIDEDRWRLGSYFIVDWVLQSEGDPFTAADLLREGEDARFDPVLRISRHSIDRLLDHLADHKIVEVVRDQSPTNTVVGDVAESGDKVYRLSDEIQRLLFGFAVQHEAERPTTSVPLDLVSQATAAADDSGVASSGIEVLAPIPAQRARVIGGRYELGELVEQGTLGTVFRGRDRVTGQQVNVKLLRSGQAADPMAVARFRREAEISRKLNHPQVVRVYDFVDGPDDYAIVLERLTGQSLADALRDEGPLSPGEVAGMGQVLADALAYLAGKEVFRLDLKPGNIVMADRGPVITDLGIAFQENEPASELTQAGVLIGTPAYMAPELINDIPADARTDIYALGLVLYECLGGKAPWHEAQGVMDVLLGILNEPVDVSGLDISPQFRATIEKAIAKDRDERFRDAAAFGAALRQVPEWRALHDANADRVAGNGLPDWATYPHWATERPCRLRQLT